MVDRDDDMRLGYHPIGVAAERTGLNPHVIRVWERRYRAVEPARTDSGRRLYSDADIERLRLMALATAAGRGISQVARLPVSDLAGLVHDDEEARRRLVSTDGARASRVKAAGTNDVARALARAQALDAAGLEQVLRRSAALLGAGPFLDGVATPLLRQVSEERSARQLAPSVEQLALGAIRRVIEGIVPILIVSGDAPNLLVATPVSDRHEIEAVMAAAVAAIEGWRVTYLGPDVPVSEIAMAAASTSARAVSVTVPRAVTQDLLLHGLRALRVQLAARVPLLVGGPGALAIATELRSAGVTVIESLADLRLAFRATAGQITTMAPRDSASPDGAP